MTETHSMLQRMKTLTTQAANSTYTDTARNNIRDEITALNEEITRIANTTEFNGKKPLAPAKMCIRDRILGKAENLDMEAKPGSDGNSLDAAILDTLSLIHILDQLV